MKAGVQNRAFGPASIPKPISHRRMSAWLWENCGIAFGDLDDIRDELVDKFGDYGETDMLLKISFWAQGADAGISKLPTAAGNIVFFKSPSLSYFRLFEIKAQEVFLKAGAPYIGAHKARGRQVFNCRAYGKLAV